MAHFLELTVAGIKLDVRRFSVREELNEHYSVTVWCRNNDANIDLESCVGAGASFKIAMARHERTWTGGVAKVSLVRPETTGDSTYLVEIAPPLWFTSQVRQRRIFQHMPTPDIVEAVLAPYNIAPKRELGEEYKDHEYIVQYGETDFEFINRLLQDAGIAYRYDFGDKTQLILTDAPEEVPKKVVMPYVDEPNPDSREDFCTKVRLSHRVRPGKVTIRDFDFRKKLDFPLKESHEAKDFKELEQYFYAPGAMLIEKGGRGPKVADDEGTARHLQSVGRAKAQRWLGSMRRGRRSVGFTTNVVALSPGVVFSIEEHPHSEIADSTKLLVTHFTCDGNPTNDWIFTGESYFVDDGYEPAIKAKKSRIPGVQSAIVTGPKGEEIYTDEFGRVRVQFQWDRDGKGVEEGKAATKWMRVNQPWAGRQFGAIFLPRVGHEVLVRYFEGDPEQPAVVGRVYNKLQPVPYPLPKHEIKAVWKTDTTPHAENSYNEIRLDDRQDLELFYTQAQLDREELVRRHEFERTGVNRVNVVGKNRSTIVGHKDVTMVGKCYSVQIVKPPSQKDLHLLDQRAPELEPTATKLAMVHDKIFATTGDATVEMDGGELVFEAKGEISIKGRMVIIEGGPKVKINCGSSHSGKFGFAGLFSPAPPQEEKSWFTWLGEKLGLIEPAKPPAAAPTKEMGTKAERLAIARRVTVPGGSADAADAELVAQELAKMPKADLEKLEAGGVKVVATRGSVTDHLTHLKGVKPRGWPPGSSWDSVPGLYNPATKEVVIATKGHGTKGGAYVPPMNDGHGSYNLTLHEAGHGLDDVVGGKSDAGFLAARTKDLGALPSYETQAGEAGPSETWAESYAIKYGGAAKEQKKRPGLMSYFDDNP
jgi:type VI secretion system secreted protein VgrG